MTTTVLVSHLVRMAAFHSHSIVVLFTISTCILCRSQNPKRKMSPKRLRWPNKWNALLFRFEKKKKMTKQIGNFRHVSQNESTCQAKSIAEQHLLIFVLCDKL